MTGFVDQFLHIVGQVRGEAHPVAGEGGNGTDFGRAKGTNRFRSALQQNTFELEAHIHFPDTICKNIFYSDSYR